MKLKYLFGLFFVPSLNANSALDRIIIPAEIKNDSFYQAIYRISETEDIKTILEIGSSNGAGSTEAFALGIQRNPNKPTLYCMEISQTRFAALQGRYAHEPRVKCYNVSSIPAEAFPSKKEIIDFYYSTHTNLNNYPLQEVLRWLGIDIQYIVSHDVIKNGIEHIKQVNGIDFFDIVLIDGSEFSGKSELKLVYGAKFILLDDINAFKNYENYHSLLQDPHYELIEFNWQLRNGYAIFRHKDL